MYPLILFIHMIVCVLIIALVLLQQGKGAQMGAAFGSGASSTVFGSQGASSFLFKMTAGLAALFFVTCIGLTYMTSKAAKQSDSVAAMIPSSTAPSTQTIALPPATEKQEAKKT